MTQDAACQGPQSKVGVPRVGVPDGLRSRLGTFTEVWLKRASD